VDEAVKLRKDSELELRSTNVLDLEHLMEDMVDTEAVRQTMRERRQSASGLSQSLTILDKKPGTKVLEVPAEMSTIDQIRVVSMGLEEESFG